MFSGAGGMSLGFQKAGFELVLAIDCWNAAVKCYSRNFKNHEVLQRDLSNVKETTGILRQKKFDVIIGGPPCQDFSTAGKKVEGKRASLTKSFAAIIVDTLPKYFVMENVQNARRSQAYATARRNFKRVGYGLTEIVLDASFCGVPQRRKRFFCIGILHGEDRALELALRLRQTDVPCSVRDCFGTKNGLKYFYSHPRTYRRRAVFSVDEPAPTVRSGGNRPLPPDYSKHKADAVDPFEYKVRALTMQERAALQMFPADYKWGESRIENELLISNAVPVGLSQFVADALHDFDTTGTCPPRPGFLAWLCCQRNLPLEKAETILSRYRKAWSFLGRHPNEPEKFMQALSRNPRFLALSHAQQSNLKIACRLHDEFAQMTKSVEGDPKHVVAN